MMGQGQGDGRAAVVRANSASDARSSEQDIRRRIVDARPANVLVALGPKRFYTVTLPRTRLVLATGKAKTPRADTQRRDASGCKIGFPYNKP